MPGARAGALRRGAASLALALALCGAVAGAHDLSRSESTIAIDGAAVEVRLLLDLLEVPAVDRSGDGRVSYDELDAAIERIAALVSAHYVLRAPGPPVDELVESHRIRDDHVLDMRIRYRFDRPVTRLEVTSLLHRALQPDHQHLVRAEIDGALHQAVLAASAPTATFLAGGVTIGRVLAAALGLLGVAALVAFRLVRNRAAPPRPS